MRMDCPPQKLSAFGLILILVFFLKSDLGAQQQDLAAEIQKQARVYRSQGLELQNEGNIDAAIPYYEKAILLDPNYAVAYNDLGIIFEAKGWSERAKQMYLKAITIEPDYPNSYSNLALLYEEQGDYTNAIVYWMKRAVMLSDAADPWAAAARKRIEDIALLRPEDFRKLDDQYKKELQKTSASRTFEFELLQPQKSLNFTLFNEDDIALSQELDHKGRALQYLARAKKSFSRGEYVTALKEATVAEYLDSSNKEISAFVEKVRKVLLR